MEVFTAEEFNEKFEELVKRIENGERIGILKEDGQASIIVPLNDNFIKIKS